MFLVEKTNHHFKSLTKNPPQIILKPKQQSFDDVITANLKTLTVPNSSSITLSWMSRAVTFLTTIHAAAYNQINQMDGFGSEKMIPGLITSYMDHSMKVLELCNLMTSAFKDMTERKMLLKLASRLLKSPEKTAKTKEVLGRCVECTRARGDDEKSLRAKVLIGELVFGACKLPVAERTLHALGALTVLISNVLVTVLYGESEMKQHRVTSEFSWADSVNSVQKELIDQVNGKYLLTEVEDTNRLAANVCDVITNGNEEERVRVVKEFEETVVRFCEGVDELTNRVNGLFNGVMKTRNGVLDGVRKCGSW